MCLICVAWSLIILHTLSTSLERSRVLPHSLFAREKNANNCITPGNISGSLRKCRDSADLTKGQFLPSCPRICFCSSRPYHGHKWCRHAYHQVLTNAVHGRGNQTCFMRFKSLRSVLTPAKDPIDLCLYLFNSPSFGSCIRVVPALGAAHVNSIPQCCLAKDYYYQTKKLLFCLHGVLQRVG